MGWLRRWRNSRGFGVHSPFGYMLAKEVVLPDSRYCFYSEETLRRQNLTHKLSRDDFQIAMRMLRLILRLQPKNVSLPDRFTGFMHPALKKGTPLLRILKSPEQTKSKCVALFDSGESLNSILKFLETPGCAAYCLNRTEADAEKIFEAMECGILILGRRNLLAIHHPEMQKIAYQMYV